MEKTQVHEIELVGLSRNGGFNGSVRVKLESSISRHRIVLRGPDAFALGEFCFPDIEPGQAIIEFGENTGGLDATLFEPSHSGAPVYYPSRPSSSPPRHEFPFTVHLLVPRSELLICVFALTEAKMREVPL